MLSKLLRETAAAPTCAQCCTLPPPAPPLPVLPPLLAPLLLWEVLPPLLFRAPLRGKRSQ